MSTMVHTRPVTAPKATLESFGILLKSIRTSIVNEISNETSTDASTQTSTSTSTSTFTSTTSGTNVDQHTNKLQETRTSWAKTHQSWQEYIKAFESMGFDGVGIFGLDAQLWAKSCSKYAKTTTSTPSTTSTTSTCTPPSTTSTSTSPSPSTAVTTTTTWDSRLFGHYGEPLNIQLDSKDWHIHTDEVRAIICGLSNTKTIGLQRSSEEEQREIAAQREACAEHMIPDLVGFVVEYLKEGPTFGEALGSSGVLINGQMYRFIRGEPLDYIVGLKGNTCVVIYRTHQCIIIGTSKGTDTFTGNHRLRELTYRVGTIVDALKRQDF